VIPPIHDEVSAGTKASLTSGARLYEDGYTRRYDDAPFSARLTSWIP
jgi:hypothetical protein